MRIVKTILALVISIGILCGSAYMYKEWHTVTDDVSSRAQAQTSILQAVDVLENAKLEYDFDYSFTRKYELPNQALWGIKITKWGVSTTCDILEEYPRIDFSISSDDYEETVDVLEENGIDFTRVRQLN